MIDISNQDVSIRIMADTGSWIEGEAVRQLTQSATRQGMEKVVGMPDLHPGRGNPVGAAFLSREVFYPYLVGNDIGCGIGFYKTTLRKRKIKRDRWAAKLSGLETPWEGDLGQWRAAYSLPCTDFDVSHGTIGGGNHFAELQTVEQVLCKDAFERLGLDRAFVHLVVHSGSRGMGDALLRSHTSQRGVDGLTQGTREAVQYMAVHDVALDWSRSSRHLIAHRLVRQLGADCEPVLDCCHNSISRVGDGNNVFWLHRKGAVPADRGSIVIPGSRGTLTYLVQPEGAQAENLWSLAHGAGRKWNRSSCRERLKAKCRVEALKQTDLGGRVICEDRDLLYEEAPQAYKNIGAVVADMKNAGRIRIIATFRPLITYKMRI